MEPTSILLADLAEILKFLVVAAIIGFSIISKLLNSNAEGQAQNRRPPPRPTPKPRPHPPAGDRAQPQSIEQEIETFLRQARGEKQPGPPPRPKPPVPPTPPTPRRPVVAEAVTVEKTVDQGRDFRRSISAHTQDRADSKQAGDPVRHLAERIESADERVEQHLEEVFDHEVGHLAQLEQSQTSIAEGTDAAAWEQDKVPDTSTQGIAEMLRSPQDIRKVFVLSEILKRPDL